CVVQGSEATKPAGEPPSPASEVSSCTPEGFVGATPHLLVTQAADLAAVAAAVEGTGLVALDLETTGLDPRKDRARLLSLGVDVADGTRLTYLVDCFAVDPSPLWGALVGKELLLHNACFDLEFLAALGFTPGARVHDTM